MQVPLTYGPSHFGQMILQRIGRSDGTIPRPLVVQPLLVDFVSKAVDQVRALVIGSRYVEPSIRFIATGTGVVAGGRRSLESTSMS